MIATSIMTRYKVAKAADVQSANVRLQSQSGCALMFEMNHPRQKPIAAATIQSKNTFGQFGRFFNTVNPPELSRTVERLLQ